jgi:predicted metalloprotease with PDZ domain
MTPENFIDTVAGAATGIENTEARKYISPANSSVSTWVGYDTPVAFGISYYTQGQNLAALLDLSILNDTNGRHGLDDVMRSLYTDFYRRGRGFTTEDMIGIVNRITGKDYHGFYRRYVFGTEVPDYQQIVGYAGYKMETRERQEPELGFYGRFRSGGFTVNGVEPDSPASAAGLHQGDVITKIDGRSVVGFPIGTLAGKSVKLTVNRRGEDIEMPLAIGSRTVKAFVLTADSGPSNKEKQVRDAWLKR